MGGATYEGTRRPVTRLITARIKNTAIQILAIDMAVPDSTPKPSAAAISANTKKVSAHESMIRSPDSTPRWTSDWWTGIVGRKSQHNPFTMHDPCQSGWPQFFLSCACENRSRGWAAGRREVDMTAYRPRRMHKPSLLQHMGREMKSITPESMSYGDAVTVTNWSDLRMFSACFRSPEAQVDIVSNCCFPRPGSLQQATQKVDGRTELVEMTVNQTYLQLTSIHGATNVPRWCFVRFGDRSMKRLSTT